MSHGGPMFVDGEPFFHRPPAFIGREVINITPPVSGILYPIFSINPLPQRNVRLISIWAEVTWTVQPTPLQLHLTIDGVPITFNQGNPTSGTTYYAYLHAAAALNTQPFQTQVTQSAQQPPIEAKNLTVCSAEITGGTVQALEAAVIWARWPS